MSLVPQGYHLVGSVHFSSAQEVFETLPKSLCGRLKRLPDGETGERHHFTLWQWIALLQYSPIVAAKYDEKMHPVPSVFSEGEVSKELERLKDIEFSTNYDKVALESYEVFKTLKQKGDIPMDIKFQVSLPTPANVIAPLVEPQFQRGFEPMYEKALFGAIRRIQDGIPHSELAIQLDLAVDTAFWEEVYFKWWGDENPRDAQLAYLKRMIDQIDSDVELGLHNCYGDIAHKHFFEPTTLSSVVDRFVQLKPLIKHSVKFFHVPVPPSVPAENLQAFFAPLKQILPGFEEENTELYLGVVQAHDTEGTKARIEAAKLALGDFPFGIATECGWGRTPEGDIESIVEISKACCEPWRQ